MYVVVLCQLPAQDKLQAPHPLVQYFIRSSSRLLGRSSCTYVCEQSTMLFMYLCKLQLQNALCSTFHPGCWTPNCVRRHWSHKERTHSCSTCWAIWGAVCECARCGTAAACYIGPFLWMWHCNNMQVWTGVQYSRAYSAKLNKYALMHELVCMWVNTTEQKPYRTFNYSWDSVSNTQWGVALQQWEIQVSR